MLIHIKAPILDKRVSVKKLDVRSIQVSGGKVKIPKDFSLGAIPDTTTKTATTIAERNEGT